MEYHEKFMVIVAQNSGHLSSKYANRWMNIIENIKAQFVINLY